MSIASRHPPPRRPIARARQRLLICALSSGLALVACACGSVARGPSDEAAIQRACAGLADTMLDQGVAELRSNFDGSGPLREGAGTSSKTLPRQVGAVVQIRAARGMTAQWLERMLQCDTARHGDAALIPAGASSEVVATPTGFVVSVRSEDADLVRAITQRAALFAHPPAAACNTPQYHWNEALNASGPGRCASDCECDGLRSCVAGSCQGAAR